MVAWDRCKAFEILFKVESPGRVIKLSRRKSDDLPRYASRTISKSQINQTKY